MAKALKYFAYYGELPTTPSGAPRQYKLEFWFEGFTGTATEVKMGGNGFKVSELSNDDEIQGLKEEKYSIQLIAPAGSGLTSEEFYIRNEEEVVIKFFADNVLIKTGYLTGETLSEEYHDATKHINLEAISGLRRLKDKDYVDANGKAFRGTTTIAEKINRCLQATGLGLPVRMSHHLHAIPTDLNNNEGFIVRYEDLHHKGETYYDVLDKIARTMNLSIFQEDGYWYVLHVFSKVVGTRGYQQFTPSGDFDGNGVLALTRNALHKSTVQPKDGTFIYEPALKKVSVTWKLGKYKNYLLNDIFEDWDGTNFASWDVFNASRPGTIIRTGLGLSNQPFRAKITGVNTNPFETKGLAQTYMIATRPDLLFEEKLTKQVVFSASAWARDVKEIYARVSVGFRISGTGGRTIRYYLADDNTWSMKNDTFLKVSTVDPNGKSKNSVFQFDINAPRIDELKLVDVAAGVTVGILNIDQVSITVNLLGGQGATKVPYGATADPYVEFSNIGLQLIDVSTNLNITELRYEAINNANATRKVEIQAAFGDFVDASQNSALQFFGEEKTTYWRSDEDLAERELLTYTARDILRSRASVRKVWEGVLWGDIKRSDLITLAEGGAKYAFVNYEYDYTKGMASVRMVKLNEDNPNITLKKYAILRDGTEIEMDIQGFDMPELVNPFMIPSSVPFSILDNLFNLTNIVTVDYGFLNLQSLDNLFTGLKVVEGETEIRNFELTSTGLKSVTAGKTFSLDSSSLTAEANLKIADTLTSAPETLATREWAANGLETKYLQLDTTYTNGNFPGRLSWDADHDLMFLGLENDYTAKVPQDAVWSCIAGEAITKGQLVYASGTVGSSGKIQASRFIANGTIPSRFVIGVATRTVAQGETFHALRAGVLRGLDTSAYTAGQDLWASSTVAGGFQTTAPTAPNPKMSVAFVITSHAQVGELAVRIIPSLGISLLDDVQIASPVSGQILRHTGTRWENFTPDFASVPTAGTVNRIPRFSGARILVDSGLTDNGTAFLFDRNVGIAQSAPAFSRLLVGGTLDVTTIEGINNVITTGATTTTYRGYRSFVTVNGALNDLTHLQANGASLASGASISTQVGFRVLSTLTQGATNIAFRGEIPAATNRWNLFMDGTAINYLRGALLLNRTVSTGEQLQVTGTAVITGNTAINGTLTVPTIGNSAGISAQNTWTFASNVNVPLTPSASTHATSKSYVDNLVATGIKEGIPVRSISLTNITLSGTQTVSGVALVAGDRVLVAGQTTASQNGVYIVASGAWTRATDSDTDAELRGYQYLITAGTFINAKYRNTNEMAIVVGVTAITYVVSQGAETDPIFSASPAAGITQQFINNWNANYAVWGELTPESIFANRTTSNLPEGTNLYFTDARARAAVSAGTGISYNSSTGVISSLITQYTDAMARAALFFVEGPAGYNSTTGVINIPTTTNHIVEGSNLFYTNARSRLALSFAAGSGAYNSGTGVITIPTQTSHLTNNSGFITSSALSGYVPTTRTINGFDLSENRVLTTSNINEGTNLYFTDARSRSALSFIAGVGNYNSGTGAITIPTNTNHVAEGSNLYYTDARARLAISVGAGLSYNSSTGVITNTITQYTDTLARLSLSFVAGVGNYNSASGVITIPTLTTHIEEGTRQYFTNARARAAISSGTGLSYNSETGVMSNLITQYTDTLARLSLSFVSGISSYNNVTGVFTLPTTTNHISEATNLYFTNARARAAISLTTLGTSGAASYNSLTGVLNIPNYTITNPITGVLTAGRIPVATAAGVLGDSNLFQSGVNIGLGTTNPLSLFVISSNNQNIEFGTGNTTLNGGYLEYINRTTPSLLPDFTIMLPTTAARFKVRIAGGNRLSVLSSGNVLINKDDDTGERLQVNGSARITSMAAGASTDELVTVNSSGVLRKIAYTTFVPQTRTINGLDLSANRTLTTTNIGEGTNLYFTNARARSAISLTVGTTLTAPTYNASTGVLNLPATLLQDRQFTDVAAGLRQLRSIDYYESRMDFGFDKVLDVPYLYYDKNGTRYVNYMNGDGVFVHVDGVGNEREYVRRGDIVWNVPNLQQISEEGYNSTVRLQFNGIDYATLEDITSAGGTPNLQQVAVQGNNASIRLQFNGVNYATVNDIVASTTPNLQQVSQQGANSTIRLQFNGVNYATLNDIGTGGTTPNLSQVLAAGNNAGTAPILFGTNAFIQGISGSLFLENTGAITLRANSNNSRINLDTSGAQIISGASFVRCDPTANSVQIAGLLTKFKIDLTANVDGVPYAFHQVPGTLTAGAKYVFQWDGSKFIITNA